MCISHFQNCTDGAKGPPKPAATIVRCCPRNIVNQNAVSKADIETIDESISAEEHSSSQEIFLVDFYGDTNLSYSKPVGYSYFGEEKVAFASWAELYVSFFATVIEDYPHAFYSGMSFSKTQGRTELVEEGSSCTMIAPKAVPGTSYLLETNLSADHVISKIKYILDLCNVDYENVTIKAAPHNGARRFG